MPAAALRVEATAVAVATAMLALLLWPAAAQHDYGDALHKSILFFEGQRSGRLPPDQRLRWRGDSGLHDGSAGGVRMPCSMYNFRNNGVGNVAL
ncbi:hypothetical protein GUJ93_ZPchr0006g44253 [Zizania palustris]|uniref:Glycoside hydrolase family 9 domain-containing protein n=1 Tax=Zizania palustris TaxID=103762 RepID=A0A8J5TCY6_ZIZPA|nr:hypothetical protein GUJ93_ZPchr0006g44253 [Zizania palustris]